MYLDGPPADQAAEACPPPTPAPAPPTPTPASAPPTPTPRALLHVELAGDPGPAAPGETISYQFTVTNAGNVELTGVFWGSPALGVAHRPIGDERLAPGASAVVTATFGPVTTDHLPGPLTVRMFGDTNQTHVVWATHSVPLRAPAQVPPTTPTPAESRPAPEAPSTQPDTALPSQLPPAPAPVIWHAAPTVIVERTRYLEPDAHLRHNIPDLRIEPAAGPASRCDFLAYYDATGGLPCWGYPTSEVLSESPGVLTQYFQRGVLDCYVNEPLRLDRRLVWEAIGGGVAGAPDLGAEPTLRSTQPGPSFGPWGHRVSNYAVDGTSTGFLDFFEAAGGVAFFGYPKTDARRDHDPGAVLALPGAPPGVIRQYFQAGVLEYHPADTRQPVKLALLGDAVRDRRYPHGTSADYASFGPADPLAVGQVYTPQQVAPANAAPAG